MVKEVLAAREYRRKAKLEEDARLAKDAADKKAIEDLIKLTAEHSKTLTIHTAEISNLQAELNSKIADIKSDIKLKIDFVTNLMSSSNASNKAYVDAEVAKLRTEINTKTDEVKDLIKNLDDKVKQEVDDLKAMDKSLDAYAKATNESVNNLYNDFNQKFADLDIRITANFDEIKKLKDIKQTDINKEFRDFMKEMKTKINNDIPKQFADLRQEVRDLEDTSAANSKAINTITEILDNTEDVLSDGLMGPFKDMSDAMKARLEFIKASGAGSKADVDAAIAGLKGDISAANTKLTKLEQDILKANADILDEALKRGDDIQDVNKHIDQINESIQRSISFEKSMLESEFNRVMSKYGIELQGISDRVTALETWQTQINEALYGTSKGGSEAKPDAESIMGKLSKTGLEKKAQDDILKVVNSFLGTTLTDLTDIENQVKSSGFNKKEFDDLKSKVGTGLDHMIKDLATKYPGLDPAVQNAITSNLDTLLKGQLANFETRIATIETWKTAVNDALYGVGGNAATPKAGSTMEKLEKALNDAGTANTEINKIKAELVDAAKAFGNATAADFSEFSEAINNAGAGTTTAELNALKDKVGAGLEDMIQKLATKYPGLDQAAKDAITSNLDILLKGQLATFETRIATIETWKTAVNDALYGVGGNAATPKAGSTMEKLEKALNDAGTANTEINKIKAELVDTAKAFGNATAADFSEFSEAITNAGAGASKTDLDALKKDLEAKLTKEFDAKINELNNKFTDPATIKALDEALSKLADGTIEKIHKDIEELTNKFDTFVKLQTNINNEFYGKGGTPANPGDGSILQQLKEAGVVVKGDLDKVIGQLEDIAKEYSKSIPATYENFAENLKAKIAELEAKGSGVAPANLEQQIKAEIAKQVPILEENLKKDLADKITSLKGDLSKEAIEQINSQLQDAVKSYVDANISKMIKVTSSIKTLNPNEVAETLTEIKNLLSKEGAPTDKLQEQINKLDFSLLNQSDKTKLTSILNPSTTHNKLSAVEEAQLAKILATSIDNYLAPLGKISSEYTVFTDFNKWFIKDSFYSAAAGLNEINIKSLYSYDKSSNANLTALQTLLKPDANVSSNKELYDDVNHSIRSFNTYKHLAEPKKFVDLNHNLQMSLNKDAAFKNEVGDKYKLDQAQSVFKSYEDLINEKGSVKGTDPLKAAIADFSNINKNAVTIKFFVTSTKAEQEILELFKNDLTSQLQEFIDNKETSDLENIKGAGIDPVKLQVINEIITQEKGSKDPITAANKIILEKFILEQDKKIRDVLDKELKTDTNAAGASESNLQEDINKLNKTIDELEKDIESVVIPSSTGTSNEIKNLEEVNANIKKLAIYNGDKDKIESIEQSLSKLSAPAEKAVLEQALNHIKTASQFEIFKDKLAIENSLKNLDADAKFTGYDDFINKDFTVSLAQHISSTVIKSLITQGMTTQQFKDELSLKGMTINDDLVKLEGVKAALDFTNGIIPTGFFSGDAKLSSTNDSEEFKLTKGALSQCKTITDNAIKVLEGTINTDKLNKAHWQDAKINLEHAQKVFQLILDNGSNINDDNARGSEVKVEIHEFTHLDHDQIHLNDGMIKQI